MTFKMTTPVDPQLVFETSHFESHYNKQDLRDVLEQAAFTLGGIPARAGLMPDNLPGAMPGVKLPRRITID